MEEEHEKMSLRARRRKSSVGITCCFSGATQHHRRASFDATSNYSIPHPSPRKSSSTWFKSKASDLPEIKGKCRSLISRMAHHRRHSSADFSYDPLSYALNFDDDASSADDAMSFSARLQVSSPRKTPTTALFDHNLPKTPIGARPTEVAAERWKREEATPKIEAGNDNLRRGFEALSISMKRSSINEPLGEQISRNKSKLSSSSPRAAAEVRKSLESDQEVTSPVGVSSNKEILVQFC